MLQLIFGGAGTGKTALLYEQIDTWTRQGKKAILLVPEQASFEAEKTLYRKLGAKRSLLVEVYSFTRLCDQIFRVYGGMAGVHLDDTAKLLLMSVAIENVGGMLKTYRKNPGNAAFAQVMCETIREFKTAGVTPDKLEQTAQEVAQSETGFCGKLSDIALMYESFQAMVEMGYDDPDDHLTRASRLLEGERFFSEYGVFIDGFMAFMGAEWKLIAHILRAQHVAICLPCRSLEDALQSNSFAAAAQTAAKLKRIAKQNDVDSPPPILLEKPLRYHAPDLAFLAEHFAPQSGSVFNSNAEGVDCVSCEDRYEELEFVASHIAMLVRDGYRYREIAVIGRDLEDYLTPMQSVFARYNIPYFADLRLQMQMHPFASGLMYALEAIRGPYDSQSILALSKSCIMGISPIDAAMLENYVFLWSVSDRAWTKPFMNHPEGMTEEFTQAHRQQLERLNQLRETLIQPLQRLKKKLKSCNGLDFASSLFDYLTDIAATDHLQQAAETMPPIEKKQFLEQSAQVWDALVNVLDIFGGALADTYLPLGRMAELLRMSFATLEIGILPQTLDQVLVGMADRIRPNEVKAVFVIGLNEGAFPQWGSSGGVFSPTERETLKELGLDLLRTPNQQVLFENYYLYFALTQASHRLWLLYPSRNTGGDALVKSSAITRVCEMLSISIQTASGDLLPRAAEERAAYYLLAQNWRQQNVLTDVLQMYFEKNAPERIKTLKTLAGPRVFQIEDAETAQSLFGTRMRLSPSRVQRFFSCPFSYFCEFGLRARPRRRVDFDPLESGELIHFVLEGILRDLGVHEINQLHEKILADEISKRVQNALAAKIQDLDAMPERFKYLFRRLVYMLTRLIKRIGVEFSQSLYVPRAFELPIRQGGVIEPLRIKAPDGTTVLLEGVVDRVDTLEINERRYIRVVDYKSGKKDFLLSDVENGLDLQMLMYLFTLCDNRRDAFHNIPAGVLYMPARDALVTAPRDASASAVETQRKKQMCMKGLLLDDLTSLTAMEAELKGVFIPPVLKEKDGSVDPRNSLVTMENMNLIRKRITTLLGDMVCRLHDGDISATPFVRQDNGAIPCGWCAYKGICGHEETDAFRLLAKMDLKEALAEMKKAQEEEGE